MEVGHNYAPTTTTGPLNYASAPPPMTTGPLNYAVPPPPTTTGPLNYAIPPSSSALNYATPSSVGALNYASHSPTGALNYATSASAALNYATPPPSSTGALNYASQPLPQLQQQQQQQLSPLPQSPRNTGDMNYPPLPASSTTRSLNYSTPPPPPLSPTPMAAACSMPYTAPYTSRASHIPPPKLIKQGAEAKIYSTQFCGKACIIKERFKKSYRHSVLDKSLTEARTKSEVRAMIRSRSQGIQTPAIYFVDLNEHKIYMEHIENSQTVKDYINSILQIKDADHIELLTPLAEIIGGTVGMLHHKNTIHGDLTTSNMLLRNPPEEQELMSIPLYDALDLVVLDFGLSYVDHSAEDKGVDLYVLERAFLSTHPDTEELFEIILGSYRKACGKGSAENLKKLDEVRQRGRKRTMVG